PLAIDPPGQRCADSPWPDPPRLFLPRPPGGAGHPLLRWTKALRSNAGSRPPIVGSRFGPHLTRRATWPETPPSRSGGSPPHHRIAPAVYHWPPAIGGKVN